MCDVLDGKRCGVLAGEGQVVPRTVVEGQNVVNYVAALKFLGFVCGVRVLYGRGGVPESNSLKKTMLDYLTATEDGVFD